MAPRDHFPLQNERCVLFIAHPGHELRLHRALELARPLVHVLTDGSGSNSSSRLDATRRVLESTGARPGSIFGRYTDRTVYDLLLRRDFPIFLALADELAHSLHEEQADLIAGDMVEGYNSTHDVCRLLIGASVEIAQRRYGCQVKNYDFPLMGLPDRYQSGAPGEILIPLDDEAFARKLAAAQNYQELAAEVENAMQKVGEAPFRREILRPVPTTEGRLWSEPERPFYETYGEKQVAAGLYRNVIRFDEHLAPLSAALERHCRLG